MMRVPGFTLAIALSNVKAQPHQCDASDRAH
jgi:hypothetical protein